MYVYINTCICFLKQKIMFRKCMTHLCSLDLLFSLSLAAAAAAAAATSCQSHD